MANNGWISLYRSLFDNWMYDEKPFDKTHAWIDILLQANSHERKVALGDEVIVVPEGAFITSEVKLMQRWGWSKEKTRRFLKLLESDGMIVKKTDRKKTTIFVVNWGKFQDRQTKNRPKTDQQQTDSRPIADTNNNVNKVNNIFNYKKQPSMMMADYGDLNELEEQLLGMSAKK